VTAFIEKGDHALNFEELATKFGLDLKHFGKGSALLTCEGVFACIWVGVNNASLMISKEEIKDVKYLLGL